MKEIRKEMTADEILKKAKIEYVYKKSNFMDSLILLKSSSFKYFKKISNGKNLLFHPHKLIHYFKLKSSDEFKLIDKYIDLYLNKNEGWYQWYYIPKDNLNNIKVEIHSCVGKHYKNAITCGYGFYVEKDPHTSYGWKFWVSRWRFKDKKEHEVVELECKEEFK